MTTFDDCLLSKEDLGNIDNDNETDDNVDKSSSHNEEMKKVYKFGKKEVDKLNEKTKMSTIL